MQLCASMSVSLHMLQMERLLSLPGHAKSSVQSCSLHRGHVRRRPVERCCASQGSGNVAMAACMDEWTPASLCRARGGNSESTSRSQSVRKTAWGFRDLAVAWCEASSCASWLPATTTLCACGSIANQWLKSSVCETLPNCGWAGNRGVNT